MGICRRESDYWRELTTPQSWKNYSRDVARVLCAFLRSVLAENSCAQLPYTLPTTVAGRSEGLQLVDLLSSGQARPGDLHTIIKIIWEQGGPSGAPPETFLLCFIAAWALREDGTLTGPGSLVTLIAHLKYLARCFCMREAVEVSLQAQNSSLLE